MTNVQLLKNAIAKSGLSHRKYAELVLTRDERTIRRWLAGQTSIPRAVVERLQQDAGLPTRRRPASLPTLP